MARIMENIYCGKCDVQMEYDGSGEDSEGYWRDCYRCPKCGFTVYLRFD